VADGQGALYGTTFGGGAYRAGAVYKLAPSTQGSWKQNILYSFMGGVSGDSPSGDLVLTSSGRIYGSATAGGNAIVFRLTPPTRSGGSWNESLVYQMSGAEGTNISSLIFDGKGRLYGTTNDGGRYHLGSVFVLSPGPDGLWREQDIYSFQSDAGYPALPSGLVMGASGVVYGVASQGGSAGSYAGTVFSVTPPSGGRGPWTESTLYSFVGGAEGSYPAGDLALDETGTLYGSTFEGGIGDGTVFKLTPPSVTGGVWGHTVIYTFQGGNDGSAPISGVVIDDTGALYGTTQFGGDFACGFNGGNNGCGTALKLTPPLMGGSAWVQQTLHSFAGNDDGVDPGPSQLLILGTAIYGTTLQGGNSPSCSTSGCGTVFLITQ
jgi:uncharacterized repeat protein (TIGR03803 family)